MLWLGLARNEHSIVSTRRRNQLIKVALVISNLEYGGAQRQLVELTNMGRAAGIEYVLVALSDVVPLADKLTDRNQLYVIQKHFKFDFTVPIRLSRLLRRLEVDIAHGFLFDAEMACRIAALFAGDVIAVGSERNSDYRIKRIQLRAYRLTKSLRTACIANSESGAKYNARMLGYPSDHYHVVYNCVDTDRFCPRDKRQAQEQLGLDPNFSWVGMFGSFKAQKNHKVFFEAARRLIDSNDNVRLLLVGDTLAEGHRGTDEYKKDVLACVDRLGLAAYCNFLGNRQDVESVYPACDITVLPSLHEGTPNVALESMACGVPKIASDVSDNSKVIRNNETGRIVPVNDSAALAQAMRDLLEQSQFANYGSAARDWVCERFSKKALADNMAAVYQELVSARRR